MTTTPPWTRYVALGDSFSEGLWDAPDGTEAPLRGWADVLAARLSARRVAADEPPLEYANLAIRGRKLTSIVTEQVDEALAMAPDLVSLVGGGNDLLRPDANPDRLAQQLEVAVVRLRSEGVDVLLATGFDTWGSPMIRRIRPTVAMYNALIWSIARRNRAYVLDAWGMRSLRDWRVWSEDRIHLTEAGHARVAQAALVGLGLEPDSPDWDDPLAPLPPASRLDQVRWNARWVRTHWAPWLGRRLRGRSSGDGRSPKRPIPTPVTHP